MVDCVFSLGVENSVTLNRIIEDTTLGDFLGLEAFVFREVLAIVVTQVVV